MHDLPRFKRNGENGTLSRLFPSPSVAHELVLFRTAYTFEI